MSTITETMTSTAWMTPAVVMPVADRLRPSFAIANCADARPQGYGQGLDTLVSGYPTVQTAVVAAAFEGTPAWSPPNR